MTGTPVAGATRGLRLAALWSVWWVAMVPAHAAWQLQRATPVADHYADDASLQALSGMRRVWELEDLRTPDARGVRSWRSFVEYDCRGARQRVLERRGFAGAKAGGAVLSVAEVPGDWAEVPPGGAAEAVLRWACQRH